MCFLLFIANNYAQQTDAWVFFKDKPNAATYISNPLTMLSQRALDRRNNQSINLVENDVPVETTYVNQVANSSGITVKASSKWLNALHIQGLKTNIDLLLNFPFVDKIEFADKTLNKTISTSEKNKRRSQKTEKTTAVNYGTTEHQTKMLEGHYLHNLGYLGEGKIIALLDAGYNGVETFSAFSNLHDSQNSNGEILGGYDYVHRNTNFYFDTGSTHGLSVLSTIAGFIDSQFVGTAPNAQFYLFVTEDDSKETPLEESLWVEAAEKADSLGVDIINSSLGYSTFDNAAYNYSYADMNGTSAFISRGAQIATEKGMVVVVSAGNSGNDSWHYITAPADANSVISVGAVDASEAIANFSSFGPTSDNRIKPEVLAQGQNVYVIDKNGSVATSNGTSFSSPIIAGMVAVLWQAFPNKTASEIKQAIVASSDLFNAPTAQRGYGIPNFETIFQILNVDKASFEALKVLPNPVQNTLKISFEGNLMQYQVPIKDVTGKLIRSKKMNYQNATMDVSNLLPGVYFAEVTYNFKKSFLKFIKID